MVRFEQESLKNYQSDSQLPPLTTPRGPRDLIMETLGTGTPDVCLAQEVPNLLYVNLPKHTRLDG